MLFDDRAADGQGTENASVLVACEDEADALSFRGDFGGMACYSYKLEADPDGSNAKLVDERFEWNWFPGQPTTGPWPK